MKKIWRICIVTVLALCIMSFGLVGCNTKKNGGDRIEDEDVPEDVIISDNGKEVYVGSKEGKTRLKISYTLAGYGSDWLKVLAANFVHDNPEYWLFLDGDSGLTESLSTNLETGSDPSSGVVLSDIYMPLASNWAPYASNGWLEEISDIYDAKPEGEEKTVFEKTNASWQRYCESEYLGESGKYAFPWTEAVSGFAYNAGMFERYNWSVPTTVNEFIALCGKIKEDTNNAVQPIVYPGSVGGYFDFLMMSWWLQASGVEGLNEFFEFDSYNVYDPKAQPSLGKLKALETFVKIFGPDANYCIDESMSKNHTEAQLSFLRGEAAMIPNASWLETEMLEDMPDGFQIRMMRTPYDEEYARKDADGNFVKYSYATSADYMVIPKMAPQKEAAKKFLVYTTKDDMLRMFTKYTGATRPFSYELGDVYDKATQFTKDCIDIWSSSQSYFDLSTSPLYKKGYAKKFVTEDPYDKLVKGPSGDGYTPERFCRNELQEARSKWAEWTSKLEEA